MSILPPAHFTPMALQIVPYSTEHEEMVARFNERAKANRAPFQLSKTPRAGWLPKEDGRMVFREFFLAIDGEEVRGGFTLRRQDFWIGGDTLPMANYQGPLSEGLWNRKYMMSGVQMLRAALRDQPLLYALGMGSMQQPLPKLLASAGWSLQPVPFFFHVLRPAAFLRNIQPLRRGRLRTVLFDIAAATGLGALAVGALQFWRKRQAPRQIPACEQLKEFGDWANGIWEAARKGIAFAAIRDQATQNTLFADSKNLILRCGPPDAVIGWAVVRCTPMTGDKYFGSMKLGSLVDCLALPGRESEVVAAATQLLKSLGADLVVTNQTHEVWQTALASNGFFQGPSNFLFASSPSLTGKLGDPVEALPRIHFNRADGDGPIHL